MEKTKFILIQYITNTLLHKKKIKIKTIFYDRKFIGAQCDELNMVRKIKLTHRQNARLITNFFPNKLD